MSEKKVTKKEMFEVIKGVVVNAGVDNADELVAFIEHEQELLSKKRVAKVNEANEVIKAKVLEVLAQAEKMTVTEVLNSEMFTGYTYVDGKETKTLSTSKVSSILTALKNEGKVVRTEDKKKAYFSIAQ